MTTKRVAIAVRGAAPATVSVSLVLTCAGLLWLTMSSRLSAVGARMDVLEAQRSTLIERRAEALLAYSEATDARVLEAKARALGLAPAQTLRPLVLDPDPGSGLAPASALGVMLAQRERGRGSGPVEADR